MTIEQLADRIAVLESLLKEQNALIRSFAIPREAMLVRFTSSPVPAPSISLQPHPATVVDYKVSS